jgi:outer membrane lipoprotein-sorting protein
MTPKTNRRLFLLAGAAALSTPAFAQQARRQTGAAALSAADQALVDKAVAYLQGLERARGRFTQTDPRGKKSSGDLYLQRPGKARFVYDKPNDLLMVSDGNQVVVVNPRLKSYDAYALRMTPLALFLAKEIRLDRGVVVNRVERLSGGFAITASDRNRETQGQITLVFSESPMQLREWTVTDAQRGRTRIVLNSLSEVGSLDRSLFALPRDPRPRGGVRPG